MGGFIFAGSSSLQTFQKDSCIVSFDSAFDEEPPTLSTGFLTIEISNYTDFSKTDENGNYDDTNNSYIVPFSGYYQISTLLRVADGLGGETAISYGQGAHTSNQDNVYFLWSVTNEHRNGLLNLRIGHFDKDDEIRMIGFAEEGLIVWRGNMSIIPLFKD